MDINELNRIKNLDTRGASWNIASCLRDVYTNKDYLVMVVALAALASVLKETGSKNGMISRIENAVNNDATIRFLKKISENHFDQILELSEKYECDILKAVALFSEPSRFTEADLYSTPAGITKLAISLLEIAEDDVVLDMGSGFNSFLIQSGVTTGAKSLHGVEINTERIIVGNIRALISGLPISNIQGNIVSQDFSYLNANKVFSNPPFNFNWSNLQEWVEKNKALNRYFKDAKRTVSSDWVYAIASHLNQKDNGKTVVLMTNAGTWNKPDEVIRKKLIDEGIIEGIILLPAKLLSYTSIALTVVIFSQNNKMVRMVDASDRYSEGRRLNTLETDDVSNIISAYYQNSDISRTISTKEISEQEYILNPQRYVKTGPDIKGGIPLGDISISINRGAMISSSELDALSSSEDTGSQYLMLQNIQDGIIDTNLPALTRIDYKNKKYCIHDKNLVISKISPFKVAMAHVPENKNILANGNLYFIELDTSKVNPIFVEIFLQSEAGMAQLNRYAKGTAMKSISIQDLKQIKIPPIPLEKQNAIVEKYEILSDELLVLHKQIEIIKDKKARLIEEVV